MVEIIIKLQSNLVRNKNNDNLHYYLFIFVTTLQKSCEYNMNAFIIVGVIVKNYVKKLIFQEFRSYFLKTIILIRSIILYLS